MMDKLVNEHTEFVKGKLYLVQDYIITENPKYAKKACDFIMVILRKAWRKLNIHDENNLWDYHTEVKEGSGEITYHFSIKLPLREALSSRLKERYLLWEQNKIEVTSEEEELFKAVKNAILSGKKVNLDRLSVFYGLTNNHLPSPSNMPGFIPEENNGKF